MMASSQQAIVLAVAPALALLTHAILQWREPWGHHAFYTLLTYLVVFPLSLQQLLAVSWLQAIAITLSALLSYILTLSTSILIYRIFFHPLRNIPGPLWAKSSMWFWVPLDGYGRRAKAISELHREYGKVVRIGPNWVSINDAKYLPLVYGTTTIRGPWYRALAVAPHAYSVHTEPTRAGHAAQRRIWEPAFHRTSIPDYQPAVSRCCTELLDLIDRDLKVEKSGQREGIVEVHRYIDYFAFDIMGELGWGRSFNLMHSQENGHLEHIIGRSTHFVSWIGNVPYMRMIINLLPWNPSKDFREWVVSAIKWRISQGQSSKYQHRDIFGHLLGERDSQTNAAHRQRRPLTFLNLLQNATLLTIAGSHTTSTALALVIMELSQHPVILAQLRAELDANASASDAEGKTEPVYEETASPLLRAVIKETLRLWPVVPVGPQRTTTQRDIVLPGGHTLPANTHVSVPFLDLKRSPSNFLRPTEWIPERWIIPDEYQPHNVDAFKPFGFGSTSCIGKRVAWQEMLTVVAQFVKRFDFEMSSEDADVFRGSLRGAFLARTGPLLMKVSERQVGQKTTGIVGD